MSQIQRETREVIDDVYSHPASDLEPEARCPDPPAQAVVVPAATSGYVQAVQPAPLVETATGHDLVVRLTRRVGDHVVESTPIAWAWPRAPDQPPPTPELLARAVGDAVQVGFERTMVQDVLFGLRRLVDIANKALSPAVNDPYTAIQAVHHLSVLLCVLAPADGWATNCAATNWGSCGWRSRCPTLRSTCGAAPPRSGGSGPPSHR
jgi:uncharacterized membrane protein